MLLLTKIKQFSSLVKIKRNRCYCFSCNIPTKYVNACPESKILSLKYPYLQLLIQISQFYIESWHKLLKSKQCYFLNITLPWMKIWRSWSRRYLHNHGWFPSVWEIAMPKVQAHRSYSPKTFFHFFWNAQLCLIFIKLVHLCKNCFPQFNCVLDEMVWWNF